MTEAREESVAIVSTRTITDLHRDPPEMYLLSLEIRTLCGATVM
ncbi:unnamed protein product [Brassica oleracea]